ncbi:MAG: hypothetical protein ACT4OS_05230 [Acidimicrobiales bacterium]
METALTLVPVATAPVPSRRIAVAMAQRVFELETLVNSQAALIEDLTGRVARLAASAGGRWDPQADPYGVPVHHRCRGRRAD